jgi:hypothetical protein
VHEEQAKGRSHWFTSTPCCATPAAKKLDADVVIIKPNGYAYWNGEFPN